jgi:predicted ester cyclase
VAATIGTSSAVEEIARSYFDAVGRRDVEGMIDHWEPGGIGHLHGIAELRAPEGYREWFGNLFQAFPDMAFEVLEVIVEGDKAAVHWRATGTFTGDVRFEGLAATGASVEMRGCDVLTISDGRVRHNDAYTNGADLARQLGALPPAGSRQERALTALVNARTRATRALRRSQ